MNVLIEPVSISACTSTLFMKHLIKGCVGKEKSILLLLLQLSKLTQGRPAIPLIEAPTGSLNGFHSLWQSVRIPGIHDIG